MEFINEGGEPYWEWLHAVPLLHQLQLPDGLKIDGMSIDPSRPNWGTKEMDKEKLKEFSQRIQSKRYGWVNVLLNEG